MVMFGSDIIFLCAVLRNNGTKRKQPSAKIHHEAGFEKATSTEECPDGVKSQRNSSAPDTKKQHVHGSYSC